MNKINRKILIVVSLISTLLLFSCEKKVELMHSDEMVTGFTNSYYDPNSGLGYYPSYNPNYSPYYPGQMNVIPSNSYYYIVGYDRHATQYSNGHPMISRVPIIGGNNYYPTRIANGIIYNAYVSISSWCNSNILSKDGIQDYYLNYATILSETASSIVLKVNCSFKRKGVINGYTEFQITADIENDEFTWHRITSTSTNYIDEGYDYSYDEDGNSYYEYDDGTKVIIIR